MAPLCFTCDNLSLKKKKAKRRKELGLHEKENAWAIVLGWNAPTARSIPQTGRPAKSRGSCFSEAGKKSHRYPVTRLTRAQKAA